jgi:CheY-like chemotaxis protein
LPSRHVSSEDEPAQQLSIEALLGHDDIDVSVVSTGSDALEAVSKEQFDCVVLDLRLPDMTGFELLEQLSQSKPGSELPVVVFTGKDLSPEEDARLHMLARSVIVKDVESPERF